MPKNPDHTRERFEQFHRDRVELFVPLLELYKQLNLEREPNNEELHNLIRQGMPEKIIRNIFDNYR
jgi:hypothetical protein